MTVVLDTVFRLGFRVWMNPRRFTNTNKTSHWWLHVANAFRFTSPSRHFYRLSLQFTNSYVTLRWDQEGRSHGQPHLCCHASPYACSSHTHTHATPFPPWREGKGWLAGVRAIWAPGGRVPLSPTKQATMAVPEVGCPWLQRTVNSFKAYAVGQSWLNQFRQLGDTVESHILNHESETFSLRIRWGGVKATLNRNTSQEKFCTSKIQFIFHTEWLHLAKHVYQRPFEQKLPNYDRYS
jgi:hypothetical protein